MVNFKITDITCTQPAIKDVLESIGETFDVVKKGGFQLITPKPVFVLSLGYAHHPEGLKFVQ